MLVWGSKSGVTDLGPQGSRPCPVCEKERNFRLLLQYKVSHIWYVFKWVSQKQYAMVCEVCQRGEKLVTQVVEAKIGQPVIPTGGGRGWVPVAAVVAGLFIIAVMLVPQHAARKKAMLDAPQRSDIYVMNVAPLLKSPQSLAMYGLLRVRNVDGDRVEFDVPAVTYDKVTGATKDLRNGKVGSLTYFAGGPLVLSRSEIAALGKDGVIQSVERP